MKNILKDTKSIVFLVLLFLSSCASHTSKVSCPSFDCNKVTKSKKVNKGKKHPNFREVFSFIKRNKSKNKRMLNPYERDEQFADFEEKYPNSIASAENENSLILVTQPDFNTIMRNQNKENDNLATSDRKVQKSKRFIKINRDIVNIQNYKTKKTSVYSKKIPDVDNQQKSERKTAIIKGGAIILMAILAGISIPVLGTLIASIGLVAIFLLDALISLGIYRYYKKEKPKLATVTSLLRLLYTAIFGIGIGYHIAGSVSMFNKFWQIGLIGFGLHLIALGILFNNEGGKKWVNVAIKSLLITAGIGYMILNIGILLVPNPVAFRALIEPIFILPQILGEISFAIWMILKGGKK